MPAWKLPTVSTTGSNTLNFLVTIVCRAVTISQAAGIGSAALCGWEACPPRPCTVTSNVSAAAMIVPGRVLSTPPGSCADATCSPYAATGRPPAASSTPSSIMILAPPCPSSPGWNMKITLPGSSPRRADSSRAAPASIAVCRSCPQACIVPSICDANGSPVRSVTGSASISPRSSTAGPGWPPRSTATTELSPRPQLISSGRPSRALSTFD